MLDPCIPRPGGDEALALGCLCPVSDNRIFGKDGPYWTRLSCPVHYPTKKYAEEENDGLL